MPASTLTLRDGDHLTAANGVSIDNGATLQGSGTVTANVSSSGGMGVSLGQAATGAYDQLQIDGNLALGGTSTLAVTPRAGFSASQGDVFNIINIQGSRAGTFSGLAEGASIPVGGSNLSLTYQAGNGNDIALVAALTAGSVNYANAGAGNYAYVAGIRDVPAGGGSSTLSYKGLDILAGSSYNLGVNETLNLDNCNGTLNIAQGGVFSGNGIVCGNIQNSGLARIPIVMLNQVSGGNVVIPPPTGSGPNPTIPSPTPVPVLPSGTRVEIGSSTSSGGGGFGGVGSPGPGVSAPPPAAEIITIDPCGALTSGCGISNPGAIHAVDASLEVKGFYTQDANGITRLFVAGNDEANYGPSRSGGTYSQLFVHDYITLDGKVQVVLQPEWFGGFGYTPHVGDTFDFFTSDTGINWQPGLQFETFVTTAGADLLSWLTTSSYSSGIIGDPDSLLRVMNDLFDYSLVNENNQWILRGTLVAWGADSSAVPEPSVAWLLGAGWLAWGSFGRRRWA